MKKKILFGLLSVLLTVGAIGGIWVKNGLDRLHEPAEIADAFLFTVERGASFTSVAHQLEEAGVVDHGRWLRLHARLNGLGRSLKTGTYENTPGMAPLDVVNMIATGQTKSWPIRLIEGWTFRDVRNELAQHKHLQHTIQDLSGEEVMAKLGDTETHPEGMFFPDTYRYEANETDLQILQRAYDRLQAVLAEEWAQRSEGLPYETPYEALIMASLVEKETGVVEERPEIAGVFVRRLDRGMRLQTDPTIIYGLGESYTGNLTRKHLLTDGEYNTYRRDGLTPTPIALAGREAIHAALHPAEGDALFFVARGDGSHVFSSTLAEHQAAVQKFQIDARREDYRSSPGPGSR